MLETQPSFVLEFYGAARYSPSPENVALSVEFEYELL